MLKFYYCRIVILCLVLAIDNTFAHDCGLVGPVKDRLSNCKEKIMDDFSILTRMGDQVFYFDHKTQLTWFSPDTAIDVTFQYNDLKSACLRPYALPRIEELRDLFKKRETPFKKVSQFYILKNKSFHRHKKNYHNSASKHLRSFLYYYDFKTDRRVRVTRKIKDKKLQIICVAKLKKFYLFEGRD